MSQIQIIEPLILNLNDDRRYIDIIHDTFGIGKSKRTSLCSFRRLQVMHIILNSESTDHCENGLELSLMQK